MKTRKDNKRKKNSEHNSESGSICYFATQFSCIRRGLTFFVNNHISSRLNAQVKTCMDEWMNG